MCKLGDLVFSLASNNFNYQEPTMSKNMITSLTSFCLFASVAVFLSLAAQSATSDDVMKAYQEAQQKMMANMQDMTMTEDADKEFVMMMMPHHQGAIDMAQIQPKFGKDPQMLAMAKKIIEDQTKEMEEMKKWQKEHGM